jgi:hypothetical protein
MMSTNKTSQKKTAGTTARNSRATVDGVMERLTLVEVASVLRILLDKHPNLKREAEEIAAGVVSSPSVEDIADDVCFDVTSLDMDDLNDRAGKQSWGYVEPGEAAEELLGEAVDEYIDDMKRRMDLGFDEAAEAVCAGIVLGLFRATSNESGAVIEWAPDFPAEHASYVIEEYLAKYPKGKRRGTGNRLLAALTASVPEWSDMFIRITKRSMGR